MTGTGYVFDESVLHAYAFGSLTTSSLIAHLSDREIRIAIPALALSCAKAGLSEEQREGLDGVIDNVDTLALTGLCTLSDTSEFADVLAASNCIDLAAAHTITVARHFDWEIITHDRSRWKDIEAALPWPIELVELAAE
ncbi:hypothetical protein ABZ319_14830 [Nocardia sp. NPDC005978]|uniref:hypothetical protein n=1 Tax=Nocardia sp. NPDC005978 TaxID=3156725 RepID=UPI0033BF272D